MQLVEQFISFLKNQKNQPSKATIKNYKADINQFIRWFEERFRNSFDPNKATFQVVGLYKDSQSFSASSMERHLSSLRKFFNFLKLEGLASINPLEKLTVSAEALAKADPYRIKDFKDFLYVYNASHLTIKNYIIDIKQFFKWVQEVSGIENEWDLREKNLLGKIDSSFIEEYKNRLLEQEFLPSTVNRKLSSLRKYFNWAQTEGLVHSSSEFIVHSSEKTKNPSTIYHQPSTINQSDQRLKTKDQRQDTYSPLPPIRLVQKFFNVFEFVFDYLVITPLSKLGETFEYAFWQIKGKPVFKPTGSHPVGSSGFRNTSKVSNIKKSFFAPLSISIKSFPWHKKAWHHIRHTRPKWYRTYHSYPITHYFHLAILIIFMTAVGFAMYNAFATTPKSQSPAFAAPVAPPRILSFQGRLTDSSDNPVTTAATAMRMAIYNDPTASGAALLWQEIVSVSPDTDGIFSILLGNNTAITQSIFAQNATLYLGVTVGSTPELTPRQQLATVAFATNAEVLQGLPPVTDAGVTTNTNAVLALNSSGTVSIAGTATTTFQAASGQLTITGKPLLLQTNSATGGNITLAPDGLGIIDLQKPIQNSTNNNNISTAVGALEVNDLMAILATSSGQSALTINQTSTGPLISASTSGTAKFTVDNSGNGYFAGNVGIGITTSAQKLDVNGSATFNDNNILHAAMISGGTTVGTRVDMSSGILQLFSAASRTIMLNPSNGTVEVNHQLVVMANPTGSTSPVNDIALGAYTGDIDKILGIERKSAANTAGLNFTITSGGATVGATDKAGGDLYLKSGISTGTGNSNIYLQTFPAGSTGTSDNTATTRLAILGNGNVGIGTTTPLATLDVRGTSGTIPAASVSATSSFASLITDNAGVGDLFTASKSGATKFVITNAGNVGIGINLPAATLDVSGTLKVSGTTNFGGIAYTWPGSQTTNYVLQTNGSGTLSWVDANAAASSTIYWNQANGLLFPKNSTVDLTIGGQSTSSAKFAFINVNSGNPTATISGNLSLAVPTTAGANTFNLLNNSTLNFQRSPGGDAGLAANSVLYLGNNGNVGIGTTSPGAMLAVGSSTPALISSAGLITVANTTDSTSGSTGSINTLGGLGVTKDLAVDGGDIVTAATTFNLVNATATTLNIGGAATTLTMGATTGTASIRNATVNFPNATAIGIGNTAPLTALDVTGSASLSANLSLRGAGTAHTFNILNNGTLNFQRSPGGDAGLAANSVLYLGSNGNVGIGTTSPTATVEIKQAGDNVNAFSVMRFNSATEMFGVNFTGSTTTLNSGGNLNISASGATVLAALDGVSMTSANNPRTILTLTPGNAANIGLVINAAAAQTAHLIDVTSSGGSAGDLFTLLGGGNVGIGNATPLTALDVTGSASLSANLSLRGAGTAHLVKILDNGTLNFATSVGGDGTTNSTLHIGNGTASGGGNVGIGTTTPLATLDLRGNLGTGPIASFSGRTSFAGLVVDNGLFTTDLGDLITASSSAYPGQTPSGGGDKRTQFRVTNQGTIYGRAFYDIDNSAYFLDPASTGNALIVNGNVGIGNTTPLTALDVTGSASLSANLSLRGAGTAHTFNILDNGTLNFQRSPSGDAGLAANPVLFLNNNGNVGIATASAYEKLEVYGGSILVDRGHLKFTREAIPADIITYADSGIAGNLNGAYSYGVSFVTASGESGGTSSGVNVSVTNKKMNVSNIPIGSAAVTARKIYRTAAGGANPRKYVATISDNTTTTYVDNTADADLGAAIPAKDSTAGSFYINEALAFYPGETSSYNFFAGLNAGLNSGGQATFNTGVGVSALKANTTGSSSTAVGALALTSNTTGGNDAFGFRALFSNTTGGSNVGLGSQALYRNNTGNHNIGIGANAEFGNNDGHRNVVIGSNAFVNGNNSHSDNIGIGYIVGDLVTTGSRNVLIGSSVATTMTTGSDNILIGYNVQPPAVDSTYRLNIGDTIYGDLSTDKIGIGNATPLTALDVTGSASLSANLSLRGAGTAHTFNILGNGTLNFQRSPSGDAGLAANSVLYLGSNGNVGMGTTNPSTALQVYRVNSGGAGPILSLASDGGSGTTTAINFSPWLTRSGGASAAIVGQDDGNFSGNLLFQTAPTGAEANTLSTRMIINSSGNVGIGTTAPLAALDVRGTSGTIPAASVSAATSFASLIVDNAGVGDLFTASKSGATKFVVTNAGNVGIGTNTPAAKLGVNGGISAGSYSGTAAPSNGMIISGNVGIGITAPTGILHVADGTTPASLASGTNITIQAQMAGTGDSETTTSGGDILLLPGAANGGFSNAGNVGIGTTNPTSKLHIVGGNCADDAGGGGCTADYAELYPSTENVEKGDLLVIDTNSQNNVKRSTTPYQKTIVGVVSTAPAIIIEGSKMNLMNNEYVLDPGKPAVALAGRIPLKVSLENGPIAVGDPLTSSSTPGVAMKATKAGPIVAKALEPFPALQGLPLQAQTGKILAFVNVSWYDPDVFITSTGNYSPVSRLQGDTLEAHTLEAQLPSPFVLKDPFGNIIDRIGTFAELAVANLKVGFISAEQITTNSLAVTADSVTIGGENIRAYIVNVLNEAISNGTIQQFSNRTISPIASIDRLKTDFISPLASDSAIAISLDSSKLIVHSGSDASSSAVAVIDNQGNASFAGTLRAKKIIADQIEGLNIQTSTLSAQYITNNYYTSTSSATDNFGLIANSASSSAEQQFNNLAMEQFINISSFSGQLAYVENLNAAFATFTQGFISLGPSSFTDLSVINQLSIGGSLILANNSIDTLTIGSDLGVQPLRQGGISFLSGLVHIDVYGNLKVGGNAEFAKDVTIQGKLSANIISPIPGSDLVVKLNNESGIRNQATDSASIRDSQFIIHNSSDSAVLAINQKGDIVSSGSATFDKLNLRLVQPALAISNTELLATGSAGVATISAHQTEVTINNNLVTDKSLLYLTPVSQSSLQGETLEPQTPYLMRQVPSGTDPSGAQGSFTVGIQNPVLTPTTFNWLIIN